MRARTIALYSSGLETFLQTNLPDLHCQFSKSSHCIALSNSPALHTSQAQRPICGYPVNRRGTDIELLLAADSCPQPNPKGASSIIFWVPDPPLDWHLLEFGTIRSSTHLLLQLCRAPSVPFPPYRTLERPQTLNHNLVFVRADSTPPKPSTPPFFLLLDHSGGLPSHAEYLISTPSSTSTRFEQYSQPRHWRILPFVRGPLDRYRR